ncbi:MAG: hypothetical protein Q9201_007741 [Fulgogasparrea decipioides]
MGAFLGNGGHTRGTDEQPSDPSWPSATAIVDFAFDHGSQLSRQAGVGRSPTAVETSVANRSWAAPSVNDSRHLRFDLFQPEQQQQPSLIDSVGAEPNSQIGTSHVIASSDWASFLHAIPTSPGPEIAPPLAQLTLRHGQTANSSGYLTQSPSIVQSSPDLKIDAPEIRRREAAEAPTAKAQNMSVVGSIETPSPPSKTGNARRKKDQSTTRQTLAQSSLSQREDDGSKEAPRQQKPGGSLASSDNSSQSRGSLDFSRVIRSDESFPTPGIVRSGLSSASHGSLPDEKGFSIQIGSELFKLSGASIMSDAPSYFSAFFIEQLQHSDDRTGGVRTLFIDRDPETFRDIARHLQVPRLQSQLFDTEIFVEVGNQHFRVPRDIFSAPGDTPNYFTLGFTVFFSSPGDVFPGLNPRGLLRPPAIHPPRIPNRSPKIFSDILHMLRGYPLTIENEDHRLQLLKDARYYNLRGLEQKLIPHAITHNVERQISEITIRLQDIKPSQISIFHDDKGPPNASALPPSNHIPTTSSGWVTYARPFTDESKHELIVDISDPMSLDLSAMRLTLFGITRSRITSFFQTIANKLNLPTTTPLGLMMEASGSSTQKSSPGSTPLSEDKVKAYVERDTHITLDGADHVFEEHDGSAAAAGMAEESGDATLTDQSRKRRRIDSPQVKSPDRVWTLNRGQWRLRLQPKSSFSDIYNEQERSSMEVVMVAVKIDATSNQKARNIQRHFLSS